MKGLLENVIAEVVHTTSEQCTQIQARSGQQSLVITGKAPRSAEPLWGLGFRVLGLRV